MRYATSQIRNLVILTSSFFLLSACGQQTSPTKTEATKQDTAVSKDSTKTEDSQKTEDSAKAENNAKTENNTKPEAESKNTQKEQPNKQTDTITFTSEDAIKVLEKRMGARSNEIRYGSSEDKLIGTINGIKLYDVLYGRESAENSRALNFAVGSDGNLYDWSKAQDGILQPLNSN
ncbi:hypothetical protein CN554_05230 [Bacillus wiedmannii]|uniref:hypothetical protein n=1 Tax=Bacillus wiedmannii TaxID=1890302 RepID=UPI000BEFD480|nr:hypothetical protein [Bacillus wiedmannii]PEP00941.1 hypothetical protein CN554_05230 [Bacillus wiedmannii]